MAEPLAEIIADRFVGYQVKLMRLEAGERRKVLRALRALEKDVLAQLSASDIDQKSTLQQQRLNSLMHTVERAIASAYEDIAAAHDATLSETAEVVSEHTVGVTNAVIKVPLLSTGVPQVALEALAKDDLVEGRPAHDWWQDQGRRFASRFRHIMRQGIVAGATMGDLLRKVRGTRESRFQDGLMRITTREAEALIRTSLLSVANAARYETLKANQDVVKGHMWQATLDPNTCPTCGVLAGQSWDFEGNPLEGTKQDFPGPPPRHFGCRCTLISVLKSWEQLQREAKQDTTLGKKLDRLESKIGKGTQASMTGQVPADLTYTQWLNKRTESEQKEILGVGKWKLWKNGTITLSDLVDQTGRPLTLKELKEGVG
ncbi:MAG: phage minor head protein [Nitrospira sp.]